IRHVVAKSRGGCQVGELVFEICGYLMNLRNAQHFCEKRTAVFVDELCLPGIGLRWFSPRESANPIFGRSCRACGPLECREIFALLDRNFSRERRSSSPWP